DLVLEETGRRGRGHELAVDLRRDAAVLHDLAVAELDLEQLCLGIVARAPDLARIDALALHAHSALFQTKRHGIAAPHRGKVARLAVYAPQYVARADELRFLPLRDGRAAPGQGERAAFHPEAHGAGGHHLLRAALQRRFDRNFEVHLFAPGLGS